LVGRTSVLKIICDNLKRRQYNEAAPFNSKLVKRPKLTRPRKSDLQNRRPFQINAPTMAKKYGWDYQRFIPNNDPVLKVDCEFVGEEINFQELWYDHQD
jgi:hypothetical protein